METVVKTRIHRLTGGIALACSLVLSAAACGSSDESEGESYVTPKEIRLALEKGGKITVWGWEPTLKNAVEKFEKKYPKVDVKLVNAGTGDKQYTALQNAVSAGSGAPDVAQIEYYALGQFALGESLEDLKKYGADEYASTFSKGPWDAVQHEEGTYALPMDSGPMALFYNKRVFDQHKIKVPTTWDEYLQAARDLHKADPKISITSDTGDAGLTTSLIWQAGGKPYQADGEKVKIDFSDAGSTKYADTWQKLIKEDLVSDIEGWSDEWYKGLADGTIATLPTGAWMPANFTSGAAKASGDWRAAPLPQWEKGKKASAENGGSSLAIPEASKNKEIAYAFTQYATAQEGADIRIKEGAFPATLADLNSTEFQNKSFPYFDGQKANKVFAESSTNVNAGWSYLPYQTYANSVFKDTVGKSYVSGTPLKEGLRKWQESSVKYGNEQGFSVNK